MQPLRQSLPRHGRIFGRGRRLLSGEISTPGRLSLLAEGVEPETNILQKCESTLLIQACSRMNRPCNF